MSATESAGARHQMAAALAAGVGVISENQEIVFTRYRRLVLPVDGFVFWVRANLLVPSAAPNSPLGNQVAANQQPVDPGHPLTVTVRGSLHYMTASSQNEDDSSNTNQVVFTALAEVEDLNNIDPEDTWIGAWQGVRFAFSRREMYYEQAKIQHYVGTAIYSAMETQIIDTAAGWSNLQVVSNSLPVWLALREPVAPVVGLAGIPYQVFPSFLVAQNIVPPYVAVHIYPEATEALQMAPRFDRAGSQWQLVQDRVRITLYGFRNEQALAFVDYVQQFCAFTGVMGISNMPVLKDEKRTQVELGILAQKKTVEFVVNYYQSAMRSLSRQLILSAPVTVIPVPPHSPQPGQRAVWNEFWWNDGSVWASGVPDTSQPPAPNPLGRDAIWNRFRWNDGSQWV